MGLREDVCAVRCFSDHVDAHSEGGGEDDVGEDLEDAVDDPEASE